MKDDYQDYQEFLKEVKESNFQEVLKEYFNKNKGGKKCLKK